MGATNGLHLVAAKGDMARSALVAKLSTLTGFRSH